MGDDEAAMAPDPQRWQRIQALFAEALDRPRPRQAAFLQKACAGDEALRAELEAMLAADTGGRALGIERFVRDHAGEPREDPFLGARLGPWRIVSELGRGGMGAVYLAERADGQYEHRAALKLLAAGPAIPEAVTRFRSERQILAHLSHPNIARLLDGGFTAEGTPYMVMEHVDGAPITEYCDARRLGVDERLALFRTVCEAVQHAHRALVVHRDLKPSNIFVSQQGEVKILDFGIAKILDPEAGPESATRTEHRVLTPWYAAPEQLCGQPVTTATDVYTLGIVLHELLTGSKPMPAAGELTPPSLVLRKPPGDAAQIAALRSSSPARLAKRLHGDLDRVVLMALRREPERRYGSAAQLSDDIARFLDGRPVVAQPDTFGYRVRRFVGRHRLVVAASTALVLLVTGFGVVATLQARAVRAERDRARAERDKAEQVVQVLVDLFDTANPEEVPGGDRLTVAELLEQGQARVLEGLAGQPEVRSTLKHVLGRVRRARSDYPEARVLLEEALADLRRLRGDDALETLTAQVDLADLLVHLERNDAARPLLEDALARTRATLGERHPLAGRCLRLLAPLQVDDHDARLRLLEGAVAIHRGQARPDPAELALSLYMLAIVLRNRGRHDPAEALLEEAKAAARVHRGGRTPLTLMIANEQAALHLARGDFARAEKAYRSNLALAEGLLGPRSFRVAQFQEQLGTALVNQGRLQEAAAAFRASFEGHRGLLGEQHRRTVSAARNMSMTLLLLDRPAEARAWITRALAARAVDAEAPARAIPQMRAELGRCLLAEGRHREALATLEAAVSGLVPLQSHPRAATALADARLWLAQTLVEMRRPAEAEPHARAAMEHRRRSLPEGNPARAESECEMATVAAALGRGQEARALLESCVPRVERYGLVEAVRKRRAWRLLEELRAGARPTSVRAGRSG